MADPWRFETWSPRGSSGRVARGRRRGTGRLIARMKTIEARPPGRQIPAGPHPPPAVCPWASLLASLCLHFLIGTTGKSITVPTSNDPPEERLTRARCREQRWRRRPECSSSYEAPLCWRPKEPAAAGAREACSAAAGMRARPPEDAWGSLGEP